MYINIKMKERRSVHPPGMYVSWPEKQRPQENSYKVFQYYLKKCKGLISTFIKTGR